MKNSIKLLSISELLDNHFFIPSYQRGYRWTKQQVDDLLNDVYAFTQKKNKSEKEFYCLQPIVVKPKKWDSNATPKEGWEIVDGQQRLTTIKILFEYLIHKHLNNSPLKEDYGKDVYTLDYETRNNPFEDIKTVKTKPIENFFISSAYKHIKDWFEASKQPKACRESIIRTLVHDDKEQKSEGIVKIIWYQLEAEENPMETFIRINMGRIPLTNAELIKALFLQKRNFGDAMFAERKQIEIANEWDFIENTLQNDDFWWFLNKTENSVPARIEFLFDTMFQIAKSKAPTLLDFEKKYGTDEHTTFRFFHEKFNQNPVSDDIEKNWNEIKDFFLAFEEWFQNPVWYHYIGYLIYCGTNIIEIYKLYDGLPKSKFTENLIQKIKSDLNKTLKKTGNPSVYEIELNFKSEKKKLREFFLLYNLEFINKQYDIYKNRTQTATEIFMKFPFKSFKQAEWDIEHIDSSSANDISTASVQKEWLNAALLDLGALTENPLSESLQADIKIFLDDVDVKKKRRTFSELQRDVQTTVGEIDNNHKDTIGNLTLLDSKTNRSYGNALFITKRRKIIENDKNGTFIPICTKHVFLKYFADKGARLMQWTETDIKNYYQSIGKTLDQFS